MKIIFLTNNPNLGSTARALQLWVRELSSRGDTISVICPHGALDQHLRQLGIRVFNSLLPWPSLRKPWQGLAEYARIAWWARDVDLIHCNEHNVYPVGALIAKILRRPCVCHVRFDVGRPFCQWLFGRYGPPTRLLWTSFDQQQRCAPMVEGLVPETQQQVLRLGLDLRSFGLRLDARDLLRNQLLIPDDAVVLGTASAFKPIKRIEDFVQLVHHLRQVYPNVYGIIAGGMASGYENYWNEIHAMIRQLGATSYLHILGNQEDIEPVMQAMDLFVSTSELETFGNSVCEAMACAKPVVAYAGGSVAEVVGDTGRIVENGDLTGLVDATRQLVEDRSLREACGRRAKTRVAKEFDAVARVPELVALYEAARNQFHHGASLPQ